MIDQLLNAAMLNQYFVEPPLNTASDILCHVYLSLAHPENQTFDYSPL